MVAVAVTPLLLSAAPASTYPETDSRFSHAAVDEVDLDWESEGEHTNPEVEAITQIDQPEGMSVGEQLTRGDKNARQHAARLARLEEELTGYEQLSNDWDDAGAEAPSQQAIDLARSVLDMSPFLGAVPVRSYVTAEGEVGLVWERGGGYADIGIFEDGSVSYYVRSASGKREMYSDQRVSLSELGPEIWSIVSTL